MPSAPQAFTSTRSASSLVSAGSMGASRISRNASGCKASPARTAMRLTVGLVTGGLAPAQIVVVHAGQIVMDQAVVMHQLQRTGKRQRQMPVDAAQTGELQRQHRADALSAA